jgi:glyoxylase-like metal-dependent hydrolase (beta-lactamase superfamily II)
VSISWEVALAPNPGIMTLEGTNTWVVGDVDTCVVVDPGPPVASHVQATRELVAGRSVEVVLLTHQHADHSEGAAAFAAAAHAPLLSERTGELTDGLVLPCGLSVLHTPGHTGDSVCLDLDGRAVLTGDTVLGRGTTVVAWPDGALGPYLHSLERLAQVGRRTVLPGHGPVLPDLTEACAFYLQHRRIRLDQVRAAVAEGAREPAEVVAVVYADVDRSLWLAAELSVRAQLAYLLEPTEAS